MKKSTLLIVSMLLMMLQAKAQAKLLFRYDNAGNQAAQWYCEDGRCSQSTAPRVAALPEDISPAEEFKLFPNPTADLLHLTWSAPSAERRLQQVYLIDMMGSRLPVRYSVSNVGAVLDLATLPTGVYHVLARFSDGQHLSEKIIKQ